MARRLYRTAAISMLNCRTASARSANVCVGDHATVLLLKTAATFLPARGRNVVTTFLLMRQPFSIYQLCKACRSDKLNSRKWQTNAAGRCASTHIRQSLSYIQKTKKATHNRTRKRTQNFLNRKRRETSLKAFVVWWFETITINIWHNTNCKKLRKATAGNRGRRGTQKSHAKRCWKAPSGPQAHAKDRNSQI